MASNLCAQDRGEGSLIGNHRGVGVIGSGVIGRTPEVRVQQGNCVGILHVGVPAEGQGVTAEIGNPAIEQEAERADTGSDIGVPAEDVATRGHRVVAAVPLSMPVSHARFPVGDDGGVDIATAQPPFTFRLTELDAEPVPSGRRPLGRRLQRVQLGGLQDRSSLRVEGLLEPRVANATSSQIAHDRRAGLRFQRPCCAAGLRTKGWFERPVPELTAPVNRPYGCVLVAGAARPASSLADHAAATSSRAMKSRASPNLATTTMVSRRCKGTSPSSERASLVTGSRLRIGQRRSSAPGPRGLRVARRLLDRWSCRAAASGQ